MDLDLAASPVKFSLSTAPYLIMAEILSAHQVLLYPRGSKLRFQPHGPGASGREKLEVCAPFATGVLTEETV